MTDEAKPKRTFPRVLTMGALAVGLVGGSYGVAVAANGTSGTTSGDTTATEPRSDHDKDNGWGHQRSDENTLTGTALASVKQAALGKVAGSTIVRIETDADGNAAYEAHLIRSDGTPATVYVDKQFNVVSVETR
ncbi:MAG: hypothetical protein QOJ13_2542 [Gaiellales bacterium]|jgi:uncharacterized membrane protein YkoI|nr:hypothetical protein [Gaiellales bacterium]